MTIDIQRLRRDLANAGYGAFYGGGFGGGLMGAFDANSLHRRNLLRWQREWDLTLEIMQ